MTYLEAWANFYVWVNIPENWKSVDRSGRDQIKKAQIRYLYKKPADLGYEGAKALMMKYAPDRYEFKETVILHQ